MDRLSYEELEQAVNYWRDLALAPKAGLTIYLPQWGGLIITSTHLILLKKHKVWRMIKWRIKNTPL